MGLMFWVLMVPTGAYAAGWGLPPAAGWLVLGAGEQVAFPSPNHSPLSVAEGYREIWVDATVQANLRSHYRKVSLVFEI